LIQSSHVTCATHTAGCATPDIEGDHYTLEECQEELLNAEDFDMLSRYGMQTDMQTAIRWHITGHKDV